MKVWAIACIEPFDDCCTLTNKADFSYGRTALVIAHPGHELRLHYWLESAKPDIYVLTDGSGRTGKSRLESTRAIARAAGAELIDGFGAIPDPDIYRAIVGGGTELFEAQAGMLASKLSQGEYSMVVCDALEGFNPAHDLCHLLTCTARSIQAGNQSGSQSYGCNWRQYDYTLIDDPAAVPERLGEEAIRLELTDSAFTRKVKAAKDYVQLFPEVMQAIARFGEDAFRVEVISPSDPEPDHRRFLKEKPYYESYGEKQVAAGYYSRVISYIDHIKPIAEKLELMIRTPA